MSADDKCEACGSRMDFVCGPDGEGGGLHCWDCHDAEHACLNDGAEPPTTPARPPLSTTAAESDTGYTRGARERRTEARRVAISAIEELVTKARVRVRMLGRADIESESEVLLWHVANALEATAADLTTARAAIKQVADSAREGLADCDDDCDMSAFWVLTALMPDPAETEPTQ